MGSELSQGSHRCFLRSITLKRNGSTFSGRCIFNGRGPPQETGTQSERARGGSFLSSPVSKRSCPPAPERLGCGAFLSLTPWSRMGRDDSFMPRCIKWGRQLRHHVAVLQIKQSCLKSSIKTKAETSRQLLPSLPKHCCNQDPLNDPVTHSL